MEVKSACVATADRARQKRTGQHKPNSPAHRHPAVTTASGSVARRYGLTTKTQSAYWEPTTKTPRHEDAEY